MGQPEVLQSFEHTEGGDVFESVAETDIEVLQLFEGAEGGDVFEGIAQAQPYVLELGELCLTRR